ncbi:hypothetical protein PGQ11_014544 [Apiospora arundinis]|uniref:Uncharacterized protein n=1 Tax=Apiospora arundinis TaxID=335852 RepID=A0ABR2HSJ6_9PEZI
MLLDHYVAQAEANSSSKIGYRADSKKILDRAIAKAHRGEGNEFGVMHKALTGEDKQNPDVKRSMLGDVEIQARISPVSETTIFRLMTRFTQTCYPQPSVHPRYVLVLNSDGFPPLDSIINDAKVVLPEVWVIDADWDPPVEGDGFKDADGYEGRLKVRFRYNFYMHFYPLTKENGFDMKKLWMEQTDHEKPYPFPRQDITYDNVREKVPWTGSEISSDASMAQFLKLVEKDEDVAPAVLAEKEDEGGRRDKLKRKMRMKQMRMTLMRFPMMFGNNLCTQ